MGCMSSQELSGQGPAGKAVGKGKSAPGSRGMGFTTNSDGKKMEVLHDPHVPGGKRLVPTLEQVETNPIILRRHQSKEKEGDTTPQRRQSLPENDQERVKVRKSQAES